MLFAAPVTIREISTSSGFLNLSYAIMRSASVGSPSAPARKLLLYSVRPSENVVFDATYPQFVLFAMPLAFNA